MSKLLFPVTGNAGQPALDLNRFRTLAPINGLYEESLFHLVEQTQVERRSRGDILFHQGDWDQDVVFLMAGELVKKRYQGSGILICCGNPMADRPLANRQPRPATLQVVSETAVIARVDRDLLERLLTRYDLTNRPGDDIVQADGGRLADTEWMTAMLRTKAFLGLPSDKVQALFERLEEIQVQPGETVIRKGEPGDYYYIIKAGRCRVTRSNGEGEVKLAELGETDSFGEEALISNRSRNATVTMLTGGSLMRLARADFQRLMTDPLLKQVSNDKASDLMRQGALLIDVRMEEEFAQTNIRGSINIPLYLLRLRMKRFDPTKHHILYCDNGGRSSAAAFILRQAGFDASVMRIA